MVRILYNKDLNYIIVALYIMSLRSPKSFLEKVLYNKVKNIKFSKRPKVSSDDFYVPSIQEYFNILYFNYNVSQLRKIARFYKQKVSGNKKQLVYRLYNFLQFSKDAIKIQALYRGYLRRRYNHLQGPIWLTRESVNATDFLSLGSINNIRYCQFFSYTCGDGKNYGFNIKSLYNLIRVKQPAKNPYNRCVISPKVQENFYDLLRVARVIREPIILTINDETAHLSLKKRTHLKAVSLFQKLDNLGHTTDTRWFMNLSKDKLIQFMKELLDIWNYRSELHFIQKKRICPPNGNPFIGINMTSLLTANIVTIQQTGLSIIENLVTKANNRDDRSLGAFYVLGALTIVSTTAAGSLPWLFESFTPHNAGL